MTDSGHFLIFCFLLELAMFFAIGAVFALAVEEHNRSSRRGYDVDVDGVCAMLLFAFIFTVIALVFLFRGEL